MTSQKRVSRACIRCQRQKLKCDVQRPCMLCIRAGAECISSTAAQWKVYEPSESCLESERPAKRARTARSNTSGAEHSLRGRTTHQRSPAGVRNSSDIYELRRDRPEASCTSNNEDAPALLDSGDRLGNSSSTMSLVDGAFRLHNAATPRNPEINAIPGSRHEVRSTSAGHGDEPAGSAGLSSRRHGGLPWIRRSVQSGSIVSELVSLFPPYEAAALLVDTYFDRVHWFMLLFHQDEFRQQWQQFYKRRDCDHPAQEITREEDVGFISTFLMVIAIGIQYMGPHRQRLLSAHDVDGGTLQARIFAAIRARLLDIVSLSSLEAAQTCVLLGTYYLFHGDPTLAWPVCGCALRVAQALDLHRKQHHPGEGAGRAWRNRNESRKRCWWAIYEIETFCSMSYGYPHGIKDNDCDVEPLDPSAKLQDVVQSPSSFDEPLQCETTLLSYKYFMSKLSVIVKGSLAELYCIGSASADRNESRKSGPQELVQKVALFDHKLRQWLMEIPVQLQARLTVSPVGGYASVDELDRDVGASGPQFDSYIFQLQALTLRLAYENAQILVHRPLLSYRLVANPSTMPPPRDYPDDPFRLSMLACRDAALRTSEYMTVPVIDFIADTYAAAFVGIHNFTAGITIGILSSIDPLSPQSYEAKIGLQRLMAIQKKLKSRSPLSAQGLEILQRLTSHLMEKELNAMLNEPQPPTMDVVSINRSRGGSDNYHSASSFGPTLEPSRPVADGDARRSLQGPPDADRVPFMASVVSSGDVSSLGIPEDMAAFHYVPDTALSQAVADFDKAISTQTPSYLSGFEQAPENHWALSGDDGFPAPEQSWIWGVDWFPPS